MTSVVIVGAKRSPIGNFNGALSSLSAHEIGAQVILDILQTSGIKIVTSPRQYWDKY